MNFNAVFDTVVLLQAVAKPAGPAGRCLRLVADGKVALTIGEAGLAEIADVLRRDQVRKRFPLLTDEAIETFLAGLRGLARVVADVPAVVRLERDPDDEHILNLAVVSGATHVVTRDNDLLDLMNEGSPEGAALREKHPTLVILDPVAFLALADVPAQRGPS